MLSDESTSARMATTEITGILAKRLSQHLQDEESALFGVLDAVRSLHHSLRYLNGNELSRSLESEATALGAAQTVQHSRHELRATMANALRMPPEHLTLSILARQTSGELRDSVLESRRRLTEMSTEIDRLNRQNAAMIQQSLMLLRGIVGRLTKTAGVGESYNAGGVREDAHVGSLLEWGG